MSQRQTLELSQNRSVNSPKIMNALYLTDYFTILLTYSREIVCWDPSKWNNTAWNHLCRSVSNRDHKGKRFYDQRNFQIGTSYTTHAIEVQAQNYALAHRRYHK